VRACWELLLSLTAGWSRGHGAAAASPLPDSAAPEQYACCCTGD